MKIRGTVRRHLKRGQPKAKGGETELITYTTTTSATVTLAAVVKYNYEYGIVWAKRRWLYCTDTLASHDAVLRGEQI